MFDTVVYGTVTLGHLGRAFVILLVSAIIAKIISLYARRILKERLKKDHLELVLKGIRYTIMSIAIISILPIIGIDPSGLAVAGGMAAVVIGFASQSVFGNLISGLFILIERRLKIGDPVNIDNIAGTVEDITIFSTLINTYDGQLVRIPNQKVFTTNTTEYYGNVARRIDHTVGIRYQDDADKAIDIIKDLISNQPFALVNPTPLVFVKDLGNSSVDIAVKVWAPATEWFSLKTSLLWKIKKKLEENGIEVPFPQRVIWYGNKDNAKS